MHHAGSTGGPVAAAQKWAPSWFLVGCDEGRGMYGVELYRGGSTGGCRRRSEPSRGGAGGSASTASADGQAALKRDHRRELCVAAGVSADQAGGGRPKLDGFTGIVDAILVARDARGAHDEADTDPDVPRKQRHTAHRIFERLRDEHGFTGSYTIVKDYVRSRRQSTREAFVPLHHPPGHAQVDFGEAGCAPELRGQREKVAFFCLILPHSDVWFVKAYPRETTEAFLDGHVSAFAFLGGVPRSILYDNTTLAVARILGDGTRQRTRAFTHLQSHYLFRDRFGRPGKGNDKGKVEALVKTARRKFLVPIPGARPVGPERAADGALRWSVLPNFNSNPPNCGGAGLLSH